MHTEYVIDLSIFGLFVYLLILVGGFAQEL